jgi:hypothetical protein
VKVSILIAVCDEAASDRTLLEHVWAQPRPGLTRNCASYAEDTWQVSKLSDMQEKEKTPEIGAIHEIHRL